MVRVKANPKYMFKILTTLSAMVLLSIIMIMGFWAATIQTTTISSTISFTATDVDVNIIGVVTGSETPVATYTTNISDKEFDTVSKSWDLGQLLFSGTTKAPIVIGLAVRNNGIDTNPYITCEVVGDVPSNVKVRYSQIGGENAIPYSQIVSANEFSSALISSFQAESSQTAVGGISIPAYNPSSTNNLTTGKVFYYQIEFSIIDFNQAVDSFNLALGMTIQSNRLPERDSVYQVESKIDSSSPSEGGNCSYEVINSTSSSSTIKFVAEVEEGYEFDGWYIKDNSDNASDKVSSDPVFITSATADVTYYAKWKKKTYGTGTVSDPFLIYSAGPNSDEAVKGEFNYYARQGLFASTNQYYFKQMEDITITDRKYDNLLGFYDGNGHTITLNLLDTAEASESYEYYDGAFIYYQKPLFASIGNQSISTSKFYNITLNSLGSNLLVPLCNTLYGELNRVISKGQTGNGGIDNYNYGSGLVNAMYTGSRIYQCINYTKVYSIYSGVGGFCYESKGGTIEECVNYAERDSYGMYSYCSFVSTHSANLLTIKNCYSVSARLGDSEEGSDFVGVTRGSSANVVISNCYSLTDYDIVTSTSGVTITATNNYYKSDGNTSDVAGCTPKTFAELQNQSTYSGWTFGTYGTATSGWVFVGAKITIDGEEKAYYLPRLAFEDLQLTNDVMYSVSVGKYSSSPDEGCTYSVSPDSVTSSGGEVTFTATPSSGYQFIGWYDASSGGNCVSTNATFTTTLNSLTTYYAYWKVLTYTVSAGKYSSSPANGCTYSVSPSTVLSTGTSVTFTANVSTGYQFVGWYTAASGGTCVSTSSSYTTTLNKVTTYYAYWKVASYSVSAGKYSSSPSGGCTYSTSTSTVSSNGTSVTFTASVTLGYTFVGWYSSSSGGTCLSTSQTYTTTLSNQTIYYAYWKIRDGAYTISSASDWNNYFTGESYDSSSTTGKYYVLLNDISVSQGCNGSFLGYFDGSGHTITYSYSEYSWDDRRYGLFGTLGSASVKTATVCNFILNIDIYSVMEDGYPSGAVLCGSLYGNVDSVTVKGSYTDYIPDVSEENNNGYSGEPTGMIASIMYSGSITRCANYATIQCYYGFHPVGGLVGQIGAWGSSGSGLVISECVNYGSIEMNVYPRNLSTQSRGTISGIVGAGYGDFTASVSNCYNVGNLSGGSVAGIGGGTEISNCYNIASSMTICSNELIWGDVIGIGVASTYTNNYYRSGAGASGGVTYAQLQNQSTYSGWTFGTAGVSTSGWVFVNKSITIGGTTVTISLPRLAWECL